jgi:hypothetical protein
MNLFNFIQTGGFPMDTEILDEMQTAYKLYNGLGALAGDIAIIKGCALVGSTVSDGVVYINGEVLEFRSGIVAENVIIKQEVQSMEFEDGGINEVHYTRYATFGVATVSYPWASFKRAFPTTQIPEALALKADKTQIEAVYTEIARVDAKVSSKAEKSVVDALLQSVSTIEEKLGTIARGAEVNVQSDMNVTDANSDAYVKNKPAIAVSDILARGSFDIGDIGQDAVKTVYFTQINTYDYMVLGSIRSKGTSWNNDNDVIWTAKPINTFAFELYLREVTGNIQNIAFDYIIVKK